MDKQMATEAQAKEIFTIAASRNISDWRLRQLLRVNYGNVYSPRDLTSVEAKHCINGLKEVDLSMDHDKRAITSRQIKKIHALKSAIKTPDHIYRIMLSEDFGVYTSKDLNFSQAERVIERLETHAINMGVWERSKFKDKYDELGGRPGMPTPAQLRMVEGIWAELYPESDEKAHETHLRKYLSKFFHVSDMRFLDAEMVNKVLFALKAMQSRKKEMPENAPETHFTDKAV